MKRSSFTLLLVAALAASACLWSGGCKGGGAAPAAKPPTSAVPPAKTAPPAATAKAPVSSPAPTEPSKPAVPPEASTAPAAAPSQEQPYSYWAGNRRDPFRSIIVSRGKQASTDLLHPLQQYSVKDLKLVAVVWGQLGVGAMLQTPDGKGYTVYVGTAVGNRDGVVKQIKPDQIVVRERYTDIFGERKEESVVMDLHLPEEGLK